MNVHRNGEITVATTLYKVYGFSINKGNIFVLQTNTKENTDVIINTETSFPKKAQTEWDC